VNVTVSSQRGYQHAEYGLIEGVKLIESMKGASSCKTKATQQLLSSCSILEGAQPSGSMSAEELDKVKSQYAARLAVCELQEAEDPPKLPRCSSLGTSELVPPIDRDHLASCLRELQNDMVFWGSYTNNLQNVGYMCQVARAEIEKEELVEQRRASLQTTLLVTRVLSEFQQSVATQNAELLTNAQKLRDLHRQSVEELTTARKDTSATLHQLREDFGAQLQNVADKAESVIETVAASASGTNQEVAAYVQNVQHSLERIWQMMVVGNAEVAARQLQDSEDSHHMALVTQHALERVVMDEVGRLSNGLSSLSNELLLAGNQVSSIRQGHVSLADSLNQSVAKSSQLADVLDKLNVPVLEMFAKAASLTNFVFSDGFLVLLGFFSPLAAITFCAAFVQFSLMFWLLRLSLLLASSYGKLFTAHDVSSILTSSLSDPMGLHVLELINSPSKHWSRSIASYHNVARACHDVLLRLPLLCSYSRNILPSSSIEVRACRHRQRQRQLR
jgi:Tht1-like nuclear fusion protein